MYLFYPLKGCNTYIESFIEFFFCGIGNWTQRHSTSELHPQPHFFIFILKQGLTKLQRASLSSWGWLWTQILLSQPPKYWDYKRAPPRPALCVLLNVAGDKYVDFVILFFFFFVVLGIEPRGILPPGYTPSPIFYSLFWNRVSLSYRGPH